MAEAKIQWFRVLAPDELAEGRVTTVTAGHKSIALTHYRRSDHRFSLDLIVDLKEKKDE